jgi:ribosomal protein S2
MNKMADFIESEEFVKLTKKEQGSMKRSFAKIEKIYKGVKHLTKRPDYVIVLDGKMMEGFVREVRKSKIDNLVIANTDFDQWR